MRSALRFLALSFCALALLACSSGDERKSSRRQSREFSDAPVSCSVDPRRFAEAEPVRDFSEGRSCGVRNGWRVTAINGVRLSQPSIFNCAVLYSMSHWLERSMQPASEDAFGERIVKIEVPSAYACRTRNNKFGAKMSEHARGNAIDISSFTTESGEKISVLKDYGRWGRKAKFMRRIREEACGPFKTVLGPGSDRYHKDHFHFDRQRHRSGGAYCR
jgi:hypothetical protein